MDNVNVPVDGAVTLETMNALWLAAEANVTVQRDRYEQMLQRWRDERSRHLGNLSIISDRLLLEAEQRGWCDVYDEVIGEINDQLDDGELRTRQRDYVVTQNITVTRYCRVTATNEEEALELVRDWDSYDLSSHVFEDGDWTIEHRDEDSSADIDD